MKEKEKEIRLLILGLDNAGKTTIRKQLCGEPIDAIEPTLGFDIQTLYHASSGYQLNLWDVGGQSSLRAYWRNYFESTDGIIWVVDSSDILRLTLCRMELQQLLQHERLAGATLLLLANKQDVPGALTAQEIAQILQLVEQPPHPELVTTTSTTTTDPVVVGPSAPPSQPQQPHLGFANRHWSIRPCSAVTGEGLVEAMDWIVQDIGSRIFCG